MRVLKASKFDFRDALAVSLECLWNVFEVSLVRLGLRRRVVFLAFVVYIGFGMSLGAMAKPVNVNLWRSVNRQPSFRPNG